MILLTGGTGAVGRSIAEHLISSNKDFVLVTRDKSITSLLEDKHCNIVQGNIFDSQFLKRLFGEYKFETVVHCAWNAVRSDLRNDTIQFDNIIACRELLEEAGKNKVKTFIGFGSQAEYGVYNEQITEDFLPKPTTLYGVSKLAAGLTGKIIAQKYGFRFAWLRLFAAYGPNDKSDFVIPYAINCLLNDKNPQLSTCEQLWDYLYLKDIPLIIDKIIHSTHYFNDIYNLSFGVAHKLKDIILFLKELTVSKANLDFGAISNNGDLFFLEGSNSKLKKEFGIGDLTSIKKGLTLTVEWHKNRIRA